IYPNPTKTGAVTISSLNNDVINIRVYDLLGKQVKNEILTNNTLNVSDLNTGVYIIKLTRNNATVTKKLVIN
ncbi:T9SS type A sorting domain-containing protein, partial [Winogradskyella sp. UBA3174]